MRDTDEQKCIVGKIGTETFWVIAITFKTAPPPTFGHFWPLFDPLTVDKLCKVAWFNTNYTFKIVAKGA